MADTLASGSGGNSVFDKRRKTANVRIDIARLRKRRSIRNWVPSPPKTKVTNLFYPRLYTPISKIIMVTLLWHSRKDLKVDALPLGSYHLLRGWSSQSCCENGQGIFESL